MNLRHWLRARGNPHNLTRIHLAGLAGRHGFEIGDWTYGRPKVRFAASGARLSIGRYGSIADQVEILLGGNHRADFGTTYPFSAPELAGLWPEAPATQDYHATRGDVVIGHDVWIGSGAIILSGITIGHGAIIGARAVVARDVPPYGIVAGNPARLIRRRFDDQTIARLLVARWWDLPRADVASLIPLLQGADVQGLLARLEMLRPAAAGTGEHRADGL